MSEIITSAGLVFNMALEQVGNVASTITDTPVLMFALVCGIAFVGVTLFKRLLSVSL